MLCCPRDANGTYYARELANEQTLENLAAFGEKLQRGDTMLSACGCRSEE